MFEATVRDLTSEGQAVVAAPNGCTVFVSGLWVGERARLRVTALKGRVGFAECIEIITQSLERRSPPCKYHGSAKHQCGACPWMFVDYSAQLQAKQARVEAAMHRLSKDIQVNPIWPSDKEFGYRNRTQLKTDGEKLGFVAAKSTTLVDVDDCLILSEANQFSLKKLRKKLPEPLWRPAKKQKWTTLDLDEQTPAEGVSVNQRLGFQQANSSQNIRMQNWVEDKVREVKNKTYGLELFCGSGNFTKILSEQGFEKIVAAEGQESAVQELNDLELVGVEGHTINLFEESSFTSFMNTHRNANFLLLDPPRDGLKTRAGLFPKKSKLKDVIYISCDLATFARDLKVFLENKFKVRELQVVDQFPQTPHVELLCYLSR